MTALQALFIAVLQGITELFPVSSLGHAVILPALLGWHVDQHSPAFLPFLVVLHLGTAAALLLYFWRDWIGLLRAVLGLGPRRERAGELRLLSLIVIGTVPAVVLGFLFNGPLRSLFGTPVIAAIFLLVNGVVLFAGERLRRAAGDQGLAELGWRDALAIGFWQCTALIPGISRSGATIVGGLLAGLRHEAAARFSFLLATPIIVGAAVLEVPKLLRHAGPGPAAGGALAGGPGFDLPVVLGAGLAAGVTAYASIAFLMHYFKRHEFQALNPFAYYCWGAGAVSLALLLFGF